MFENSKIEPVMCFLRQCVGGAGQCAVAYEGPPLIKANPAKADKSEGGSGSGRARGVGAGRGRSGRIRSGYGACSRNLLGQTKGFKLSYWASPVSAVPMRGVLRQDGLSTSRGSGTSRGSRKWFPCFECGLEGGHFFWASTQGLIGGCS